MFYEERLSTQRELDRRGAERENSSRAATVTLIVESHGVGRARNETAYAFPAPFVGEPTMVQGSGVIVNPDVLNYWEPEGTAGVWEWLRNEKGLYTGCKVWTSVVHEAKVENAPDVAAKVKVQHWLQFNGIAIKDFGREAMDAASTLQPRTVSF